eukprot:3178581-Prymnesium_polylepis.1
MLPTRVTAAYGQCVAEIAAGGEHTAVRLCNGQLFSFGTNRQGQLGHRPLDQVRPPCDPRATPMRPSTRCDPHATPPCDPHATPM